LLGLLSALKGEVPHGGGFMKFEAFVGIRLPKEILNLLRQMNIPVSEFVRDAIYSRLMEIASNDEHALKCLENYILSKISEVENKINRLNVREKQLNAEIEKLNLELETVRQNKAALESELEDLKKQLNDLERIKESIREFKKKIEAEVRLKFDSLVARAGELDDDKFKQLLDVRIGVVAKELGISEQMVKNILVKIYPEFKDILEVVV